MKGKINMRINGFEKTTLVNFPGYVACIIFTSGCNFNCDYCQNSMFISGKEALLDEKEILEYLDKRKKILDGVVISGGEPTLQEDLINFIEKVKSKGYKVKLDTNGHRPEVLKKLLDKNLLDYVAVDIKHTEKDYKKIIGNVKFDIKNIKETVKILKESNIDYEFRTTIIKGFHTINVIKDIIKFIGSDKNYYLQNFEDSEHVRNKSLLSFSEDELLNIYKEVKKDFPNISMRGLKNKLYEKEEIKNV
ncbi:MAG: anaerobic ribonucleoside-triphosphate reductase activating protein [Bacilli bacterium]|nr:anaerobic ribonucleoside-triphosphate reductase activating protein [Bacilli bacterium]